MSEPQDDNRSTVSELQNALQGTRPGRAWRGFLDGYAPTIMGVANRYALDPDQASDCFLHVCEKLCERDFHRLLQYDPARGTTFRTWLTTVVSNLCVDWHRSIHGRPVTPTAIAQLPQLEQWAFHFRVERNLDLESSWIALRGRFPGLSRDEFFSAMAAIHQALSSKQRWGLLARGKRAAPLEWEEHAGPPNPGAEPAAQARQDEQQAALQAALSRLTAQQRLVLRLRYEQDMTLEDVARTAGLSDLHQARRLIQATLAELEEILKSAGFSG